MIHMSLKSMSDTTVSSSDQSEFPFYVIEEEEDILVVSWDSSHRATQVFNNWTPGDFLDAIINKAEKVIASFASKGNV